MDAGASIDAETIAAHRLRLFRFILKAVGDRADAEDLAQRTLETALVARDGFRGHSSVTTWLFGIALNKIREHRRRMRRREAETGEDALACLPDGAEDPATALVRRQEREELAAAIAALTDDMREVVVLVSLEGLSYESAADALGMPVGTVRSRLHRAKQQLRQALAAGDGGRRDPQQQSGAGHGT